MCKKIIKLDTHDGSNNYLEQIEDSNEYRLKTAIASGLRGGTIKENQQFIDPSGGPMIVEGEPLASHSKEIYIVKKIHFDEGPIITLEGLKK